MRIVTEVITSRSASDLIESGLAFWVLFPGDDFMAHEFMEWTGYMPKFDEITYVDSKLADLCDGHALSVNLI